MPPVGFEPTISAAERPKTYALNRAATGTGKIKEVLGLKSTLKWESPIFHYYLSLWTKYSLSVSLSLFLSVSLSFSPTALQPGVGLGLLQEFPPSFPVYGDYCPVSTS